MARDLQATKVGTHAAGKELDLAQRPRSDVSVPGWSKQREMMSGSE